MAEAAAAQPPSAPPPPRRPPPKAVLLDVNGTLFPASAAAPAFEALGLRASDVEPWFAAVLRDGFASQAAGGGAAGALVPFAKLGAAHLGALLEEAGRPSADPSEAMRSVGAAWRDADLFPDVAPALRRLKAAGIQVALLTNGSVDSIAAPLVARAGLAGVVEPLLDIGMAKAWKPDPCAYRFAAERLGLPPGDVMMVASHSWDVHGALAAGLRAAYVRRPGRDPAHPPFLIAPEAEAADFGALADALVGAAETAAGA